MELSRDKHDLGNDSLITLVPPSPNSKTQVASFWDIHT